MAAKPKTSPLQSAMGGNAENLTPNQTKSALGEAVGKIAGLTRKASQSKEAVVETGTLVLHSAETQGSLFLASMAEGYFGEEKLKLGGLDLRAPTALLLEGYGLYETLSGRRGGGHALAIGNGLMGSWLGSVAVRAGRTLREKRNAPAQGQPAGQVPVQQGGQPVLVMTPTAQGTYQLEGPTGIPEGSLNGPVREVLLTPEPSAQGQGQDEEVGRRGRRGRRRPGRPDRGGPGRRPNRFLRPSEDEEDDE